MGVSVEFERTRLLAKAQRKIFHIMFVYKPATKLCEKFLYSVAEIHRVFHGSRNVKTHAIATYTPVTPPGTSDDSLDWKDLSADDITKRVTTKVKPGSIVLFHNAALHTPAALPAIIEHLLQNGYSIVPVSEILIQGEHTIDHTGRMFKA